MIRGERLRHLRQSQKFSYQRLADLLEISSRQIVRYEANEADASSDVLARMADVLGVTADYLLGRTDDPTLPTQSGDLTPKEREVIAALRRGEAIAAIKIIVRDT